MTTNTPAQVAAKPEWGKAHLKADTIDPSDVVLWIDGKFAGNVGERFQEVGCIFDIDAQLAIEMARRWNSFIPAPAPAEQEPVATAARRILELYDDAMHDLLDPGAHGSHPDSDEMAELRRIVGAQPHQWSPAHPAPVPAPAEQEPVAWRYRSAEGGGKAWSNIETRRRSAYGRIGMEEQPLYAYPAPVPAVPEDVADLIEDIQSDECTGDIRSYLASRIIATIEAQAAELARMRLMLACNPTHRHVKRDKLYRHIGTARIQTDEPLADDAEVEIYHGANGDLWARRKVEFHDGRFAALTHPTVD